MKSASLIDWIVLIGVGSATIGCLLGLTYMFWLFLGPSNQDH